MNLKKQLGLSLVVGGGLLFGLSTTQTTAHASTYLRYYENIPNKTVSVTNKNAYVYNNGRLSRKMGTMRYYGSKVEEYYAAHVVKNGKASIYYKFRIGHRTGWVWHGYLKSIASSTGTTPTTPTNTTTNTGTTTNGKIPTGTPVENINIPTLSKTEGVDPMAGYIMQLFPGTVYNTKVEKAAEYAWDTDDSADFSSWYNMAGWKSQLTSAGANPTGFKAITFDAAAPYDKTAVEKAIEKAGYDANARSKFAGWSIGAEYMSPENADEGPQGGMGLVLLVPNP
ncbi:hypothetical protein [Secundilactobacillus mixtipabuli]|uniref:D-alanyl-D-alanine carboxypeptidase n=1 Tax=Secundilactobacillus mixtipabuli TaxID=1435342 RepID=A0A1Z5IAC8_9LACO|nr:hypothetical protein [Secundilactobacillus mixtipabuli]GAW98679.1 hypothetical protein IWT30_00638 [Secundilactobacillus mixtipabuli]